MLDFRARVEQAVQALEQDRPAEAEQGFRAALEVNPRDDQLLHFLGVALVQLHRAEEALEPLRKAISLKRRDAEYHNALGCALRDTGRYAEALESFERALKLDAQRESVHYNLGQCYQRMGEFSRAEEKFRLVMARSPEDIELIGALSALRWQALDHEGAVQILREGIAQLPSRDELRFLLADKLLSLGRFEEGWSCYLCRSNRLQMLRSIGVTTQVPQQLGALQGRTIHLYGEQGIGDEFFFLRFSHMLRERGARVRACVDPRIAAMVERSGVSDETAPASGSFMPDAGHVLLGDLPYLLEAHRLPLPAPVRFAPLPEKLAESDRRLAGMTRPLLGLTWRAGTGPAAGHRNVLFKETSFDSLVQLVRDLPGSILVLQRHPKSSEIEMLRQACGARLVDFSALNDDLEAMLALLVRIDEYVGVSNTNVHLRAALGRGARILVSNGAEFRWMSQGRGSPWFPTMAVYRQSSSGGWREALAALKSDLST